MPDPSVMQFAQRAIISPSISSAASRSDEADAERRRELSPSPEVDLSSPEFDDEDMTAPPTPSGSFSSRRDSTQRNHRATSPPLEKDEKEFTQTARGMQKRQLSKDSNMGGVPSEMADHPTKPVESDVLFGEGRNLTVAQTSVFISSPAMKPSLSVNTMKRSFEDGNDMWARVESSMEWDMRSPEHIELDELDDMLVDF
jgi:hypothetical protein